MLCNAASIARFVKNIQNWYVEIFAIVSVRPQKCLKTCNLQPLIKCASTTAGVNYFPSN